jgi:phage tail-like protein
MERRVDGGRGVTGYIHLNDANAWSLFTLGADVAIDNGSLALASPAAGTFVRSGAFVGGPFTVGTEAVPWFRLRAFTSDPGKDEHLELFTLTTDVAPGMPDLTAPLPFPEPAWHRAPRDLADVLIPGVRKNPGDPLFPGAPARQLWVGGVLRSNGATSPRIRQIRVDYLRDTAISSLPAVYGREAVPRERLERVLALHEMPFRELDAAIAEMPRLLDPAAAPAGDHPAWLPWLAAWLDFDLTDRWTEAQTRELVASAFELYGARGTIEGLLRYLKIYTGVDARITEPSASTRIWALGQTSTLGFTTQLAAAPAEGAVLDATATLDASHLTRAGRFGAALFEDVAHRFCVDVYCAGLRDAHVLDDVRAVLDREKPAHTVYSLRVIGARMRVGLQARIGIDAIVARRSPGATLGDTLGHATLGEQQTDCTRNN